jgi:hypothetical protein
MTTQDISRYLQQMDLYNSEVESIEAQNLDIEQTAQAYANTINAIKDSASLLVGGTLGKYAVEQGAVQSLKAGLNATKEGVQSAFKGISNRVANLSEEASTRMSTFTSNVGELNEPLLGDEGYFLNEAGQWDYMEPDYNYALMTETEIDALDAEDVEETLFDAYEPPVIPEAEEAVNVVADIAPVAEEALGAEVAVGTELAEVGTELAVTEGVGAALESTGVLAPLGLLVTIAGTLATVFTNKKAHPDNTSEIPPQPNLTIPVETTGTRDL